MRVLCLPIFAFLLAGAAYGQTIPIEVEAQPGSPLQISRPSCSVVYQSKVQCAAGVRPKSGEIIALGLSWTLTSPSGLNIIGVSFWDHGRLPTQTHLRPGGNVGFRVEFPVPQSSRTGIQVQVRVDFVVPASGPIWGNTNSPSYIQMMSWRSRRPA